MPFTLDITSNIAEIRYTKMFRKMFTLSFDDGTVQDVRFIELIDKYDLRATFNINSGFFGQKHTINHIGYPCLHDDLEASSIKQVYRNHEVAAHTLTHPNLKNVADDGEVIRQVLEDQKTLEALVEKPVFGMAYPCGGDCYDDRVASLILNNTPVRYARTTDSHHTFAIPENFMKWHPTCDQRDEKLFELAEEFIAAEPTEDMLFYVWGHSFELDKPVCDWNRFERFCELISHRREITYMTNGEVYNYITKKRAESND